MTMSKIVFKVGDDISTDVIYPGRFMATVLPTETPQFAFADYTEFNTQLKNRTFPPDSIILGGANFGCGSSREQAASTLKGHELIIIAQGFSRIFIQNAINLGLRTIICPKMEGELGDEIEIKDTELTNMRTGKTYPIIPLPKARQAIVDAGGLIEYTRRLVKQKHGK